MTRADAPETKRVSAPWYLAWRCQNLIRLMRGPHGRPRGLRVWEGTKKDTVEEGAACPRMAEATRCTKGIYRVGELMWGAAKQARKNILQPHMRGLSLGPWGVLQGMSKPTTVRSTKLWGRRSNWRQVTYRGSEQIRKHINTKDNGKQLSLCHKKQLQILG